MKHQDIENLIIKTLNKLIHIANSKKLMDKSQDEILLDTELLNVVDDFCIKYLLVLNKLDNEISDKYINSFFNYNDLEFNMQEDLVLPAPPSNVETKINDVNVSIPLLETKPKFGNLEIFEKIEDIPEVIIEDTSPEYIPEELEEINCDDISEWLEQRPLVGKGESFEKIKDIWLQIFLNRKFKQNDLLIDTEVEWWKFLNIDPELAELLYEDSNIVYNFVDKSLFEIAQDLTLDEIKLFPEVK